MIIIIKIVVVAADKPCFSYRRQISIAKKYQNNLNYICYCAKRDVRRPVTVTCVLRRDVTHRSPLKIYLFWRNPGKFLADCSAMSLR
jgi:hypothetical protein